MIVETARQASQVLGKVSQSRLLHFDVESSGLKVHDGDRVCGIGLSADHNEAWYFPFRHTGDHYTKGNLSAKVLKDVVEVLSQAPVLVGFNIKFDMGMVAVEGYKGKESQQVVDVQTMARLCVPEKHPPGGLRLRTMEERFLGEGEGIYNDELKDWMKQHKLWVEKTKTRLFHHVPISRLGPYCCDDVLKTAMLRRVFQQIIMDSEQVKVWQGEINAAKAFYEMEQGGVGIDVPYCREAIEKIGVRLAEIEEELLSLTGERFNINSNPQVTKALNSIGVYSPVLTDGGKTGIKNQAWGKEALQVMGKDAHPSVKLIREYKTWGSLKNSVLEVFERCGGTLHCTFNAHGAVTGRISTSDPSLQNVPRAVQATILEGDAVKEHQSTLLNLIGEEAASRFSVIDFHYDPEDWDEADPKMVAARRAIVPREGYELITLDYSQMEMIVFLCYVGNKRLLKQVEDSYSSGEPFDYHNLVAVEVWGSTEYRRLAKGLNFGLIYGIGVKKLAKILDTTVEKAAEYKQQYFDRIEGAEAFIQRVYEKVERQGFVINYMGRKYTIEAGRAYVAVNYLVQGSCADFMKDRMWAVRQALLDYDARLVIQVHDELVLEVVKDQVMEVAKLTKSIMEKKAFSISLPVEVSRCPHSWLEKQEMKF